MSVRYQSHDGEKSTSDSNRKLERIKLPTSLKGKSVLDIGCNEGFFCAEAVRRGATRVLGLDNSQAAIDFASQHYAHMRGQDRVPRRLVVGAAGRKIRPGVVAVCHAHMNVTLPRCSATSVRGSTQGGC
jgi:SAM-dependent methyltransferase